MIVRRPRVLSAGIGINSWEEGSEGRDAVLLIHGGRDQARSWDFYIAQLKNSFSFVSADLRGHGDSEWSPEGNYELAAFTADMGEVLRSIPGRVSIIGHSLGGNIALRLAAIFPDKIASVVGIECLELPEVRDTSDRNIALRFREWFDQRGQFEERTPPFYPSVASAAERMRERFPLFDQGMIDHLAVTSVRNIPGGFTWKFDHRTRTRPPLDSDGRDFDQMLSAVECPVHLFYGGRSFVPPPQPSRVQRLRQVSMTRYENAGHWLHHQELDRFCRDTAAFLKQRSNHFA